MDFLIITNNPLVRDEYPDRRVIFADAPPRDVLVTARDYIHKNHKLLTHPLLGGVKPNESPYKSVLLSCAGETPDFGSIKIIEECIAVCDKFPQRDVPPPEDILHDMRTVDCSLFATAMKRNLN